MAKYKTCYLCGERYKFCPSCWDDRNEPVWKNTFHSESCARIFQACVDYNMSLISKEDAKSIIENCDLSKQDSFRKDVKDTIKLILEDQEKKQTKVEFPAKKAKQAE